MFNDIISKDLFTKERSGKSVLFVLAIAMSIYMIMMVVTLPTLTADMKGVTVFDMRPSGYSIGEATTIIESLTESGLNYYRWIQLPLDFIYPALLGLFGIFALSYFRKFINFTKILYVLPLAIWVFDYLENIGIYFMLSRLNNTFIMKTSSLVSVIKAGSTTLFFIVLLVIIAVVGLKKLNIIRNGE